MLDFFITLCFALLLIVSILLLLVILMQRPKQEGLGASFGSQMTDQAFGAQTSNVLKKGTVFFGIIFGVLCFTLTILMTKRFESEKSDLGNKEVEAAPATLPVVPVPVPVSTELEPVSLDSVTLPATETTDILTIEDPAPVVPATPVAPVVPAPVAPVVPAPAQ